MRTWLAILLGIALPCEAYASGLSDYLSTYSLDVEAYRSVSGTVLMYDAPATSSGNLPTNCARVEDKPGTMHCVAMMLQSDPLLPGIELEHPFKRTGWFLFTGDFGMALLYSKQKLDPAANAGTGPAQPLSSAEIEDYGLDARAYLELGITPPRWIPDVIYSLGLAEEANFGRVMVQGQSSPLRSAAPGVYEGLELVWARFAKGKGAVATYIEGTISLDGSKISHDVPDGITDVAIMHINTDAGLRVMMPL